MLPLIEFLHKIQIALLSSSFLLIPNARFFCFRRHRQKVHNFNILKKKITLFKAAVKFQNHTTEQLESEEAL